MRKIGRLVIFTLVLVLIFIFSGCGISASGEVLTQEKDFTNFTYIDIGSAFDFEIIRADTYSVVIKVDESLSDYIEVTQSEQTLKIYLSPHHIFTDFTFGRKTLKAEIAMPTISGAQISGASKGTISGFKSAGDFKLVVSGASSLEMLDIGTGGINFEVSGASRVNGDVTASNADFEVSGASRVELSGSADDIILSVSGASKADLADFLLNNADVELSGASEATVNVKDGLDIVASGASRLYFLGNPTIGNISVSGASTVKHK
jgi:hypothetical protein